jgi:hypothetical protein
MSRGRPGRVAQLGWSACFDAITKYILELLKKLNQPRRTRRAEEDTKNIEKGFGKLKPDLFLSHFVFFVLSSSLRVLRGSRR